MSKSVDANTVNTTSTLTAKQKHELASIRSFFKGKKIVVQGGAWTAESREPERKNHLLEQLSLAKSIRETLENAVHEASQISTTVEDARQLIVTHTPIMNQLVALTESFRTGSTPISYEQYNQQCEEYQTQHAADLVEARKVLTTQNQKMANPQPLPRVIDGIKQYEKAQAAKAEAAKEKAAQEEAAAVAAAEAEAEAATKEKAAVTKKHKEEKKKTSSKSTPSPSSYSQLQDSSSPEPQIERRKRRRSVTKPNYVDIVEPGDLKPKRKRNRTPHGTFEKKPRILHDSSPANQYTTDATTAASTHSQESSRKRQSVAKSDNNDNSVSNEERSTSKASGRIIRHRLARNLADQLPDDALSDPATPPQPTPTPTPTPRASKQSSQKKSSSSGNTNSQDRSKSSSAYHDEKSTTSQDNHSKHSRQDSSSRKRQGQKHSSAEPEAPAAVPDMVTSTQTPPSSSTSSRGTSARASAAVATIETLFATQRSKKCHNCKDETPRYIKCQYFLVTGNRCGKAYCVKCLKNDYGQDVSKNKIDDEWHCPSCLGNCQCAKCARQRERETRRNLATQERQRQRTTRVTRSNV